MSSARKSFSTMEKAATSEVMADFNKAISDLYLKFKDQAEFEVIRYFIRQKAGSAVTDALIAERDGNDSQH